MYHLAWKLLDPGKDNERYDDFVIPDNGTLGIFTTIIYFCYQAFIVVVGLNLLIAIMNATVQRFDDKSQLNWIVESSYLSGTIFLPPSISCDFSEEKKMQNFAPQFQERCKNCQIFQVWALIIPKRKLMNFKVYFLLLSWLFCIS